MSKNEDYLDDLLNSVSKRNDKKDIEDLLSAIKEKENQTSDGSDTKKKPKKTYNKDFFKEFEEELLDGQADDFIRNFELEIDAEESASINDVVEEPKLEHQGFIENIDGIVNEAKKKVKELNTEATNQTDSMEMSTEEIQDSLYDELTAEQIDSLDESTIEEPLEESNMEEEFEQSSSENQVKQNTSDGIDLLDNTIEEEDSEKIMEEADLMSEEEPFSTEEESLEDDSTQSIEEEEQIREEKSLSDGDSADDLLELIAGLEEDEELSDIGKLLKADEENEEVGVDEDNSDEFEKLGSINELADIGAGKDKKKKKEKTTKDGEKKEGFLSRILKTLFGEDEDEKEGLKAEVAEQGSITNMSDENLDILRELDVEESEAEEKSKTKEKKAKEKKTKEKKEKKSKEKKPKEEKVKPPKPPKEKDNTPPLPKKPVILISVMAASLLILILIGGTLLGKTNSLDEAQTLYDKGKYVDAYSQVAGMSVKGDDQEFYNKVTILALVQEEYEAYVSLMDVDQYQLALDALIRGIGRYDKYYDYANEYGIIVEYNTLEQQIEQVLNEQFGVSADQARELYSLSDRDDYTIGVRKILENLGIE